MSEKDAILAEFNEAIKEYRQLAAADYHSRQGDEVDTSPALNKMKRIYQKAPEELRMELLFNVLRILTRSASSDERWRNWITQLANGIVDILEKIDNSTEVAA